MSWEILCINCNHAEDFKAQHVICDLYRDWQRYRSNCPYFTEKDKEDE